MSPFPRYYGFFSRFPRLSWCAVEHKRPYSVLLGTHHFSVLWWCSWGQEPHTMGEKNPWEISDWTGGEEIISFPCMSALPSLKKKKIYGLLITLPNTCNFVFSFPLKIISIWNFQLKQLFQRMGISKVCWFILSAIWWWFLMESSSVVVIIWSKVTLIYFAQIPKNKLCYWVEIRTEGTSPYLKGRKKISK